MSRPVRRSVGARPPARGRLAAEQACESAVLLHDRLLCRPRPGAPRRPTAASRSGFDAKEPFPATPAVSLTGSGGWQTPGEGTDGPDEPISSEQTGLWPPLNGPATVWLLFVLLALVYLFSQR